MPELLAPAGTGEALTRGSAYRRNSITVGAQHAVPIPAAFCRNTAVRGKAVGTACCAPTIPLSAEVIKLSPIRPPCGARVPAQLEVRGWMLEVRDRIPATMGNELWYNRQQTTSDKTHQVHQSSSESIRLSLSSFAVFRFMINVL